MQSAKTSLAEGELPDPFGEPNVLATLPPAKPVLGVAGIVLFVAIALLLLAARGVIA